MNSITRGLRGKLLTVFLGLAVIPLSTVSLISYLSARDSLQENALETLTATSESKANFINNWFSYRFVDLESQATNLENGAFLENLKTRFADSGQSLSEFTKSNEWSLLVAERSADLINYAKLYKYHDVFLIDTDGNILFTIAGEVDLGTNILTGRYSDTAFGRTCRATIDTGEALFSDLVRYEPSTNEIAGFLTAPVRNDKGNTVGVLAFQIKMDWLYDTLRGGVQGDTRASVYLVGPGSNKDDVTLRTMPTLVRRGLPSEVASTEYDVDTDRFFGQVVDTEQTATWLAGQIDQQTIHVHLAQAVQGWIYPGLDGEKVFGVHKDIVLPGVNWGLIQEAPVKTAFKKADDLRRLVLLMLLGIFIVVVLIAHFITRGLVGPILNISQVSRLVARGDLDQEIAPGDRSEVGDLGRNFNYMVQNLREAKQQQEHDDWLQTGQAELNIEIRGEVEIASLCRTTITYVAKYLNAHIGAFYVADDKQLLKLQGSFAFRARKDLASEFALGEGLVGQAALEKEPILLTEAPADYLAVSSALGKASPCNILIWPIMRDDEVKGVLELGSLEPISDQKMEFLSHVSANLAIVIESAQSRYLLQELLTKSQAQSEELMAQTDVLSARDTALTTANTVLAEKSERLQASEESLQKQSEELKQTNEQLQDKTLDLQKQKLEIQQAKREVEENARELEQASKYKSEFLANMSHELRTPLNSLLILSRSLAGNDAGNLTDDQVRAARVIHDGGQELLDLINDILDLSKVEAGKLDAVFESVEIEKLTQRLEEQFGRLAAEKGLDLIVENSAQSVESIVTDGQKVEQILRNLLANALKFTKDGFVKLKVSCTETVVEFCVSDSGIGIPVDKQSAIFGSFQQADGSTSRNFGGTGLGLTISRKFSELLGGDISLESHPDKGSFFTLSLPRQQAATEAVATRPVQLETPITESIPAECPAPAIESMPVQSVVFIDDDRANLGSDGRSLLIVEDDRRFAEILQGLCREKGFKCVVAGDGASALQAIATYEPNAVILDLGLPDIDGMAVLDRLKSDLSARHIPVHVISGSDRESVARLNGAIGYLRKPASEADLHEAVALLERQLDSDLKKLLVVEDDEAVRQLIAETVQFDGVEITEVNSVADGRRQLQQTDYDCLIVGRDRDGHSNTELVGLLGSQGQSLPPVIVHGTSSPGQVATDSGTQGCNVMVSDGEIPELLADKVSLFLHSLESELPLEQRRSIRALHQPAEMLLGKRILLVDDDMRNTFAISRELEAAGVKVSFAENGQVALDVLGRDAGIDLILMDIMMPEMDGYEATRRIRADKKVAHIPVIAVTANAMPEDRIKCIAAGANDYLTKPVDIDRLLSLIRVWTFSEK